MAAISFAVSIERVFKQAWSLKARPLAGQSVSGFSSRYEYGQDLAWRLAASTGTMQTTEANSFICYF